MTDNEKRAHDLAIAWIPIIVERKYPDDSKQCDVFNLYDDIYSYLLEEFNGKYPDGKD